MASDESSKTETAATKFYTRAEVSEHTERDETWIIIHNNVYNVSAFLTEHPGGEEVLLEQAGQDCTEAFEDVGHSSDARQMMDPYKIGEVFPKERKSATDSKNQDHWGSSNSGDGSASGSWRSWLIPIALGVLATLIYRAFITAR